MAGEQRPAQNSPLGNEYRATYEPPVERILNERHNDERLRDRSKPVDGEHSKGEQNLGRQITAMAAAGAEYGNPARHDARCYSRPNSKGR